ncbi:MAG: hypothetical protein CVT99_07280 [Bacteroidetes bacterium HGW-Bacteroidetes-16]|jgi:hypothetical protein|nr:MAG: hypothetical protein CVT99_07280 [Bacteroidetes bacterium HGW-Bacteroidetes-16]
MKTATVKELKLELSTRSPKELLEICLRLSKFKKENKELLTYLLYESNDEGAYIQGVKFETDQQFEVINNQNWYLIKKSVRKILRTTKTYIRYSKNKQTEVELLIHFCTRLKNMKPSIKNNAVLTNLLERQVQMIRKSLLSLHEDLRYDYESLMNELF